MATMHRHEDAAEGENCAENGELGGTRNAIHPLSPCLSTVPPIQSRCDIHEQVPVFQPYSRQPLSAILGPRPRPRFE
jgi:hypothetical protein